MSGEGFGVRTNGSTERMSASASSDSAPALGVSDPPSRPKCARYVSRISSINPRSEIHRFPRSMDSAAWWSASNGMSATAEAPVRSTRTSCSLNAVSTSVATLIIPARSVWIAFDPSFAAALTDSDETSATTRSTGSEYIRSLGLLANASPGVNISAGVPSATSMAPSRVVDALETPAADFTSSPDLGATY